MSFESLRVTVGLAAVITFVNRLVHKVQPLLVFDEGVVALKPDKIYQLSVV